MPSCFSFVRRLASLRVGTLSALTFSLLLSFTASAVQALPDAVVTDIRTVPSQPQVGDTVTFFATVRNNGTASTPSGVAVGTGATLNSTFFGAFFVRNGSQQTMPLASGATYEGEFDATWTAAGGSHTFCAIVDDINRFTESNEGNNTRCETVVVPEPDVVIDSITFLPSAPVEGDTVTVKAQIRNQGDASTPSGVDVGVGVQRNGSLLGSFFVRNGGGVAVPLGASSSFLGTVDSTWTATPGSHQFCAYADDVDRFEESDEDNNDRCATVVVLPDAIISDVTWSPAQPVEGTPVTLRATIINQGNADTPSGVDVGVGMRVDNALVGSFFVRNGSGVAIPLDFGDHFLGTADATWTAVAGTHSICAYADDVYRFSESNEANNTRCETIQVTPAPQPDLRPTAISWSPLAPTAGESVTWTAAVKNEGTDSTPNGVDVITEIQLDSASVGTVRVENGSGQAIPLAAGATASGQPNAPWTATPGTYQVCAIADSPSAITESNESNNVVCSTLTVPMSEPCSRTLGPSDFGTVGGALQHPNSTAAYLLIHDPACADVTLTLEPGDYYFNDGIDFRGIQPNSQSTQANVTVRFEAGTYNFNHEVYFSGFSSDKNLIVEGQGQNATLLNYCQDPPNCTCVDSRSDLAGCQPDERFGMLHFRNGLSRGVVRHLSLESIIHNDSGNYVREFEHGISLCFDGGTTTCTDVMIEYVGIKGAGLSVLSRNMTGLTLQHSLLENFHTAYRQTPGHHEKILIYHNVMQNEDKSMDTVYGIFGDGALVDSAIVYNTISTVGERGIYPESGTQGLWIHDNTILDAGEGGNGAGINLGKMGISDVLVSGNDITGIGGINSPLNLGHVPISDDDENAHDPLSSSVGGSGGWPNRPWNGYGINVSGSYSDGAIGIVKNTINGVSSNGIKIEPNASRVMVLGNEVSYAGVNGLAIMPGYTYYGEFGYEPRGPIGDIWVQDNIFTYNSRSGIEILPRGKPLFAVPPGCEVPGLTCPHAQSAYVICPSESESGEKSSEEEMEPPCVSLYSDSNCGQYCFQDSWQSYRVDMHNNTTRFNGMANVVINDIREGTEGVTAYYTLSGVDGDQVEPGRSSNFFLYPEQDCGLSALPALCVQHPSNSPVSRSDNTAFNNYSDLVNRIRALRFRYFDNGSWLDIDVWNNSLFPFDELDYETGPLEACDTGSQGTPPGGGGISWPPPGGGEKLTKSSQLPACEN